MNRASWTHNTNVMVSGHATMQLMIGNNVIFPNISQGNTASVSLYEDEGVRKIMKRFIEIQKMYREQNFG